MKNIEWLKEEIEEDIKSWGGGNPDYFRGASDAYENVKDWLNQLDEPEVLSQEFINEKAVEVYADTADAEVHAVFRMRDLQKLLVPTLSEMETVEITEEQVTEWLDNNEFYCHATAETVLANAVDKGELGYYGTKYSVVEKPTIPKFVAEWIEKNRSKYGRDILEIGHDFYETDLDDFAVDDWALDNTETFARAWLDGYTVEAEQKYYVYLGDGQYLVSEDELRERYAKIRHQEDSGFSNYVITFTEREIKDYDERFWPFRKPVEELEE